MNQQLEDRVAEARVRVDLLKDELKRKFSSDRGVGVPGAKRPEQRRRREGADGLARPR